MTTNNIYLPFRQCWHNNITKRIFYCSIIIQFFSFSPMTFAQNVTFAVVGDQGTDDQHELDVATMIDSWHPSFVMTVGDNIYDDDVTNYNDAVGKYYHQYMYPHDSKYGSGDTTTENHFWPTLGNHEWEYNITLYYNYFWYLPNNLRYYTVKIGDIEFFIISSDLNYEPDKTSITSAQANWIIPKIQSSTAKWKIVLYHHPTYTSSDLTGSYTTYITWPFENWNVDAVIYGHAHVYERILKDNNNDGTYLPYFTNGLGGRSKHGFAQPYDPGSVVRYNDNWGAMKVIESSDKLRFEFRSIDSGYPLIDSYEITKVLPVELSTFTATVVSASSIQLKWSTATEVNNYGFEVERKSGSSNWERIGFVAGSGNSNSPKNYSYTDNPTGGNSFSYRLKQIDVDGKYKYYDVITVNIGVSSEAQLLQNSPNPFNPSTAIKYYIPGATEVAIKIYDILGREVRTLINQQMTGGYHIVYWNGKDSRGEDVASGIYLYRLTAGSYSDTKKMNLLK
jgi:tartrate-resistant acid phosphatase type 5